MKDKDLKNLTLGDRMKYYESLTEPRITPEKHLILRIDGHHFSKYTKGLKKPFDSILARAMIETTKDLVERFDAYTGYTQSDEITLFLPTLKDVTVDNRKKKTHKVHKRIREDWEHSFGGRTQKIVSLVSAFTTMRFNYHFEKEFNEQIQDEYEFFLNSFRETPEEVEFNKRYTRYSEKIGNAYFDCRVFGVPDNDEVFNTFMWRSRDCEKNSRSMMAQSECSHKELHGKTGEEQIQYTLEKTGKDWNKIDDCYKYGTFVKKELYEKTGYHDHPDGTRMLSTVTRSRICEFSEKLTSYSEDSVKMIVSQYK